MKLHWPSRKSLACAAMALSGTLLPRESGMSLHNEYWTLGWPLGAELTVFGPTSGDAGLSIPGLPILACSFALWFAIASTSHRIWQHAEASKAPAARVVAEGVVCTLWGVILACFGLGAGDLIVNWQQMFMGAGELKRSVTTVTRLYPGICLGFLAFPLLLQWIVSRRHSHWRRALFLSVPVLLFAGVSSPFTDSNQRLPGTGWLPIVPPIAYAASRYELLLGFADTVGGDADRRSFHPAAKVGARPGGAGKETKGIHSVTNRTPSVNRANF